MLPATLVIQCFIKKDTLEGLCQSLLRCKGIEAIDLLFWQDNPTGSKSADRYAQLAQSVSAQIQEFIQASGNRFRSVRYLVNDRNLGTCKTCEVAVDYAFRSTDFTIFVEDDVIFSSDALVWFDSIRRSKIFLDHSTWAIAGEAIFFNASDRALSDDWPAKMRDLACQEKLTDYYITHNFIPSTCFATNAEKWSQFGATRGLPLGDVDLCNRCAAEARNAVFPIVPRVKDVGMLHENGYSVMIHTKAGVKEIKNTYLLAEDVADFTSVARPLSLFNGNTGRIYSLSTLLSGEYP